MSGLRARIVWFLDSKAGLLVLGFVLTTMGGAILNERIQNKLRENDHAFELYKSRLNSAMGLEERVLKSANKRLFHLQQMLPKLEHPEEYGKKAGLEHYWLKSVETSKDSWNEDLQLFRAQAEVYFGVEVSDRIATASEMALVIHNQVIQKLGDACYKDRLPRSLHGAFVDAHATVYHLLRKCGSADCDGRRQDLLDLAKLQLDHVQKVQDDLAQTLSLAVTLYPEVGPPQRSSAVALQCALPAVPPGPEARPVPASPPASQGRPGATAR